MRIGKMSAKKLKQLLQQGKPVIDAWLTIPSAWTAELLAHCGYDAITFDMQHGLIGYETALAMLQASASSDAVPLARVPWNDPAMIMRLLDAGAQGIICPMINTRREAEAFVGACRFPPQGYRSCGPIRAELYTEGDYVASANENILTLAMIETVQALDNLDEIMSTPGLDGVYVGPVDLSLSMGLPKRGDLDDPEMQKALQKILDAAHRHQRFAGIPAYQPARAIRLAQQGFLFITPVKDSALLQNAARADLQQVRQALVE
jgi:4-hydroxy-2-oxoheptanedioate aldolase